jgi:shikimate kinase
VSLLSPGRNIVLVGMTGVGKSSVGRVLADRLGRPFADTDDIVEQEVGRSIADIFAHEGERAFRDQEAFAIRQVSALRGQVIAVGGGAVLDPRNVTQLRSTGDLVLLTAPADVLRGRLEGAGATERPLLTESADLSERLSRMGEERAEAYRRAATTSVDTTGRSPGDIAEEILQWARGRPGLLSREERG